MKSEFKKEESRVVQGGERRYNFTKKNKFRHLFWFWRAEMDNRVGSVFVGSIYLGQIMKKIHATSKEERFVPYFKGHYGVEYRTERAAASWILSRFCLENNIEKITSSGE